MKKNKGIPFDEFYSNGYIDLGRVGNLVTMRNHFTEEDIASIQKNLAEQYEEKKTEIDDLITDIRNNTFKNDTRANDCFFGYHSRRTQR